MPARSVRQAYCLRDDHDTDVLLRGTALVTGMLRDQPRMELRFSLIPVMLVPALIQWQRGQLPRDDVAR